MRFIITLLALLLLSPTAMAQTPVSKDTANAYFENCVKTASPTQEMTVQGQEMLCACTAARLTQFFTMEDWQAMTGADPNVARPAYNRMMTEVYAPCMAQPMRERYYARCLRTQGAQQQICNCSADRLATYMQNHGGRLFGKILAQNANVADPWAAVENDPEFNAFIDRAGQECVPR